MSFSGGSGSSTVNGSSDVATSNLANGQVLTWNTGPGKWTNVAPTTGIVRLVEVSGSYPTRPSVPYAEFVGPDDPGSAAQAGDTWIATAS